VIAFAKERDGLLKGSARSVPGVHIRDLLEAIDTGNPGLIDKFGGHAMAAGLTLDAANFDSFSTLATEVLDRRHPDADFSGAIVTDGVLPENALTLKFARLLRESGPWGAGFPEPMFQGDFTVVEQRVVGERHLKLRVMPASGGDPIDAIAFNQSHPGLRGAVRLAYRLDVNEYRGFEKAQLIVEQITSI
jgi:single-stranded-DNA-specific exonuclease